MLDKEIFRIHQYYHFKSGIHKWIPGDTESVFESNFKEASKLGWTKDSITYNIDSLGHRNDFELEQNQVYNVYLGCSFTYGIGVPNEKTWVHVLNRNLQYPAFNLGVPGCGIDTCYRLLKYYIDKIKINSIFLFVPPLNRREIFRNNKFNVYSLWTPREFRIFSDPNDLELNCEKNIDAIKFLCYSNHIKFTFLHSDKSPLNDLIDKDMRARDLQHPGIEVHEKIAMEFFKELNTN